MVLSAILSQATSLTIWSGVQYVTGAFSLIALLVLASYYAYRQKLLADGKKLESVEPSQRGAVTTTLAETYNFPTHGLGTQEIADLIKDQLRYKAERQKQQMALIAFFTLVFACITVYAIYKQTSGGDSKTENKNSSGGDTILPSQTIDSTFVIIEPTNNSTVKTGSITIQCRIGKDAKYKLEDLFVLFEYDSYYYQPTNDFHFAANGNIWKTSVRTGLLNNVTIHVGIADKDVRQILKQRQLSNRMSIISNTELTTMGVFRTLSSVDFDLENASPNDTTVVLKSNESFRSKVFGIDSIKVGHRGEEGFYAVGSVNVVTLTFVSTDGNLGNDCGLSNLIVGTHFNYTDGNGRQYKFSITQITSERVKFNIKRALHNESIPIGCDDFHTNLFNKGFVRT